MLSSRSARLAAALLLTLLFGWTVRSCRKGATTTTALPAPPPTSRPSLEAAPTTSFPDE